VNVRQRIAGIDTNIDDVEAGADACSRAADHLTADTAHFNGLRHSALLRSVVRHVNELQACARDQQNALQELRASMVRLRDELKVAKRAVIRPPPLTAVWRESD
jgi:hypothetical protein